MREILFRGKLVDNGEWVEGVAFPHDNNGAVTMFYQHPLEGSLEGREVNPDTVRQYIGLTDKNGNRIFEDDILESTDACGDVYRDVVVSDRWNCSCCDGVYGYAFKHHLARLDFRFVEDYEIVGNIFDNPELMEGET